MHSLMRMNLTSGPVGCILKYTRPAWWTGETPATHSYLMKKPGYYLSEEAYIARLRKELSLTPNGRFPLTWIMEAADDILIAWPIWKTRWKKEYSASRSSISIFMMPRGEHEKGSLFAQVVENASG